MGTGARTGPNAGMVSASARRARPKGLAPTIARAIRWLIFAALIGAAAIVGLALLYGAAAPVSTLMLGRWLTGQAVERTSVPLEAISPHLPLAVIASEDSRFCDHGGVDWDAIRTVVEEADEDGPARGASTIPMQTAKNLFLWPSRSYVRKGLELPLALMLDAIWTKRRTMENYLNVAEWGEGVFGAEAAARRHFGKSARDLSRREAALLATALPNPLRRHPGKPSRGHRSLAGKIEARMSASGPIDGCLRRERGL